MRGADDEEIQGRVGEPLPDPAPLLSDLYGPAHLKRDRDRQTLSLAKLPRWDDGPPSGHGWGRELDDLLGGVCAPYFVAFGAAAAGAGKTAFLMQLADGLALRCAMADDGPLTPVLVVSEMDPAALAWRSLARFTGDSAATFRAGNRDGKNTAAFDRAAAVLAEDAPLGRARHWQRYYSERLSGAALIEGIRAAVGTWKDDVAKQHQGREVWPVVVIDPIQRFAGYKTDEIAAVNEFCDELGDASKREGWIVLASSDTNKASATGEGGSASSRTGRDAGRTLAQEGAAAFRGTYVLIHMADAVLYMRRQRPNEIEVVAVKNRWGATVANESREDGAIKFAWDGVRMSLTPEALREDDPPELPVKGRPRGR